MPTPWELCSALVLVLFFLWSVFFHGHCKKVPLSALQAFTLGVLLAGVLAFIPCNWAFAQKFEEAYIRVGYTAIGSLTDSIRLFLLDIKRGDLAEMQYQGNALYIAFLSLLAPVLTFSNVLSFFGSLFGTLRLNLCVLRKVYIMSELNVQSLALAQDIRNRRQGFLPPLIVFASVEEEHPLREQARQLSGLCLKGEVCDLSLAPLGRRVELFLLSEDEAANVSCATQLRQKHLKKLRPISIFVYAQASYADVILAKDIPDKHQLDKRFLRWMENNPYKLFEDDSWLNRNILPANALRVYRMDPVDILVKEVLTDQNFAVYKSILQPDQEKAKETISIMVLGTGRYGTHFLKTALWFYQKNGCRVIFDVYDMGSENGDAEARLKQTCPELFTKNNCTEPGEAWYNIRFHKGVDCLTESFAQQVKAHPDTDLVFIALGDDDTNIQTAIQLRTLFCRQQNTDTSPLLPHIYAVIYDDMKLSNLHPGQMDDQLRTEDKSFHYQLNFVGTLATQYTYGSVEKRLQQEQEALKWHLDWARKERQLHWLYKIGCLELSPDPNTPLELCIQLKNDLEAECGGADKLQWYDSYYDIAAKEDSLKKQISAAKCPEEKAKLQQALAEMERRHQTMKKEYADKILIDTDSLAKDIWNYFRKPYDHNSSIAKAVHKQACAAIPSKKPCASDICDCKACRDKRITEHMRWNAYMRTNGFILGGTDGKNTLQKLHPDLKPWDELSLREKYKD